MQLPDTRAGPEEEAFSFCLHSTLILSDLETACGPLCPVGTWGPRGTFPNSLVGLQIESASSCRRRCARGAGSGYRSGLSGYRDWPPRKENLRKPCIRTQGPGAQEIKKKACNGFTKSTNSSAEVPQQTHRGSCANHERHPRNESAGSRGRGFAVGLVPYAGRPPAWEGALGLRAAGERGGGSLSEGASPPPASPSRASSAPSDPLVPAPACIMEPAWPSLQFQVKRQAPWKPYPPPRVSLMSLTCLLSPL